MRRLQGLLQNELELDASHSVQNWRIDGIISYNMMYLSRSKVCCRGMRPKGRMPSATCKVHQEPNSTHPGMAFYRMAHPGWSVLELFVQLALD